MAASTGAVVDNGVIHMSKRRHTVRFKGVAERPAVSLNRGFSAPVTLAIEQRPEDHYFLARHDSDLFSRWQALNTLLTDELISGFRKCRGGKTAEYPAELAALAGDIAADETLEPAYRALALTTAGRGRHRPRNRRQHRSGCDVPGTRSAGACDREGQCRAGSPSFIAALQGNGKFSPDAASAGRRALRNVLLDYLSVASGEAGNCRARNILTPPT